MIQSIRVRCISYLIYIEIFTDVQIHRIHSWTNSVCRKKNTAQSH